MERDGDAPANAEASPANQFENADDHDLDDRIRSTEEILDCEYLDSWIGDGGRTNLINYLDEIYTEQERRLKLKEDQAQTHRRQKQQPNKIERERYAPANAEASPANQFKNVDDHDLDNKIHRTTQLLTSKPASRLIGSRTKFEIYLQKMLKEKERRLQSKEGQELQQGRRVRQRVEASTVQGAEELGSSGSGDGLAAVVAERDSLQHTLLTRDAQIKTLEAQMQQHWQVVATRDRYRRERDQAWGELELAEQGGGGDSVALRQRISELLAETAYYRKRLLKHAPHVPLFGAAPAPETSASAGGTSTSTPSVKREGL